jgi:outer membrane biosynthesis protein TonB
MGRLLAAAALLAIIGGGIYTQFREKPLPVADLEGDFDLFENQADPAAQAQAMSDALMENAPEPPPEPAQAAVVPLPTKSASSNQKKKSYPASSNHTSRTGTNEEPATLSSGGPVVVPRRQQLAPDALSNPDEIAEAITHTLRANNGRFEQCYNQRLKELEGLKGSWMVSFTVQPSGSPSSIRVRALTVRDKSLEECLKRQMGDLHFPKITVASAFARKYHFGSS